MPLFTINYRDELGQSPETIEADRADVAVGGAWIVLRRTVVVMSQPREIVVRRLRASDIRSVEAH